MAYNHIDQKKPKEISSGVEELILLSPSETSSKKLEVRSLSIERGFQTKPKVFRGDTMCYVVSGKGTLTVKMLKGDWKRPVNNDTAIWIPPMSQYSIQNMGDGELRYMEFSTEISEDEDISDILEQDLLQVVERFNSPKISYTYHIQYTLFSQKAEAKKLYFGLYHTLFPGGFLPRHVENLDCEETMYVTRGTGKMTSGNSEYEVTPGSLVYVPPRTLHSIENSTGDYMEVLLYESRP